MKGSTLGSIDVRAAGSPWITVGTSARGVSRLLDF